jgi:hypothetical protein
MEIASSFLSEAEFAELKNYQNNCERDHSGNSKIL